MLGRQRRCLRTALAKSTMFESEKVWQEVAAWRLLYLPSYEQIIFFETQEHTKKNKREGFSNNTKKVPTAIKKKNGEK